MTEQEELIFGLKRRLHKAIKYYDNRNFDDFINDEKSFDAVCFCFELIDEISKKIIKFNEIVSNFPSIDFHELANLKSKIYYGDNINLTEIEEILTYHFPRLLKGLMV